LLIPIDLPQQLFIPFRLIFDLPIDDIYDFVSRFLKVLEYFFDFQDKKNINVQNQKAQLINQKKNNKDLVDTRVKAWAKNGLWSGQSRA
jgi:hypothetical protein